MLPKGINYNFLTPKIYDKFFEDVTEFRTAFDLPIDKDYTVESLQLHFNLYGEEMRELFTAQARKDKIDAITDSLYVLFGKYVQFQYLLEGTSSHELNIVETLLSTSKELNFDILKAWDIVHHSNMSKLCNDDNVQATLNKYRDLGVVCDKFAVTLNNKNNNPETALWSVKVTEDCTDIDGDFYPAGKVLKSVDYTPADLSKL